MICNEHWIFDRQSIGFCTTDYCSENGVLDVNQGWNLPLHCYQLCKPLIKLMRTPGMLVLKNDR